MAQVEDAAESEGSSLRAAMDAVLGRVRLTFDQMLLTCLQVGPLAAAVMNLVGLADPSIPVSARLWQGAGAAVSLGGAWWGRQQASPRTARWVLGVSLLLSVLIKAAVQTQSGWPLSLDVIPVVGAFLALAVHWWLGVATIVAGALVVGVLYALDPAAAPALVRQFALTWVVCAVSLLYLVRRLQVAFDEGGADLIEAADQLDASRRESLRLTDQLSTQVRDGLDQLTQSLSAGSAQARAATDQLLAVLEESRRRIPSEPDRAPLEWRERLYQIRMDMLRVIVIVGSIVVVLHIAHLLWSGFTRIGVLLGVHLFILQAITVFHFRHDRFWWWNMHAAAGVSVVFGVITSLDWIQAGVTAALMPPVPVTLILLIVLGIVSGDRALILFWSTLLGTALLLVEGTAAWRDAVACLVYVALGLLLTSLQQSMADATTARRQEAAAAIQRRQRLIGTLFHDLANPLQALVSLLQPVNSPADEASDRVPPDAVTLVQRMRATLDASLGQMKPPEPLAPPEIVRALLSVFGVRLGAKRIQFLPAWDAKDSVLANRTLLQDTVLANLLSDAIKFGPAGSVIALRSERRGGEIHLEIQDAGPALPDEVRAAFADGRATPVRNGGGGERGSGSGLLLIRDYLQEMRGSLSFDHPSTGGLIARVVLPAAE